MTRARDNSFNPLNNQVAGKNFVINGNFDFFQRGSLSTTSGGYGLDRWYNESSGSGSAVTVTQQTTGVPDNSRFCFRSTTSASAGYGNQYQFIETSNVRQLWGKTVTLSIKLRRSSGFNTSLNIGIDKSSTVDAGMAASWTGSAALTISNANLPTGTGSSDWYTATVSTVIPTDGSANSLRVFITQTATTTSSYYEVSQVQLEVGPSATQFSRAGGTIGGELALCQRYYQKSYNLSDVPGTAGAGSGKYNFMTPNRTDNYAMEFNTFFKTFMRATPSVSVFSSVTGTSGVVRDEGTGNDRAIIVKNGGESNFQIEGNTTTTANALHSYQWIASAEL